MDPLIAVFLGIIAFCALVQAVFFAALSVAGWKALGHAETMASRAEAELGRVAQKLEQLTLRVEGLTRQAHEKVASTQGLVDSIAGRAVRAGGAVHRAAESPFVPLRNGAALVHGVLRAIEAYRYLRRPAAR